MNKSLCFGVISGGSIKTDTVSCILDAIAHIPLTTHMIMPVGGYAAQNRNMVAKAALQADDSHVLFIDADMIFPATAIEKLIAQDKDIIGVNYHQRQIQPISTVKIADETGKFISGTEKDFPLDTFECAAVGTGFCLVKSEVFKTMPFPYFRADYFDGEFHTEDVWFCKEAKRYGFTVWCDPTVIVHHLGDFKY